MRSPSMKLELRPVELDDAGWLDLVTRSPAATAFHDPVWARLLADCYGYRPFALTAVDGGGTVQAGMPVIDVGRARSRRWVSLPFTDHCPPLVREEEIDLADALEVARARAGVARIDVHAPIGAPDHEAHIAVIHELDLRPGADAVWDGAHRSQVQRNVGRAERDGVSVVRGTSQRDLTETFYGLHLATRRRQGVPIQPRRFFTLLWERILAQGNGFVAIAEREGRPIAAAVFLASNGTLIYKYGASDPDALRYRPNHAIFWDAIQWACRHGIHTLDWGRSDLDNRGLREFKSSWGAEERPLMYSRIGAAPGTSIGGRAASVVGAVIRHSPAVVCRGIGELLYKRAA